MHLNWFCKPCIYRENLSGPKCNGERYSNMMWIHNGMGKIKCSWAMFWKWVIIKMVVPIERLVRKIYQLWTRGLSACNNTSLKIYIFTLFQSIRNLGDPFQFWGSKYNHCGYCIKSASLLCGSIGPKESLWETAWGKSFLLLLSTKSVWYLEFSHVWCISLAS